MEMTKEDGPLLVGTVSPNSEMMDEDLIIDSTFPLLTSRLLALE